MSRSRTITPVSRADNANSSGLNNSWLWDPTCNFATPSACYTYRGGEYEYNSSSSSSGPLSLSAAGGAPGDVQAGSNASDNPFNADDKFALDTWSLGASEISEYAFGVISSSIYYSDSR